MLDLGVCYCCVVAVKVSENHKTKMRHHNSRPNMQLQMLQIIDAEFIRITCTRYCTSFTTVPGLE